MIVYADVLIFLNALVDYFLLLASAKLSGENVKTLRVILAALLGGVSSLYIFLPVGGTMVELLYKASVAFLLSAVCYKFTSIKRYLKNTGIFFLVSCAYGGLMFALWIIFKPYGMVINNSIVYFNISPTVLVVFSVVGYLLFTLLWRIFKKSSPTALRCGVTVTADGKSIKLNAIADTGNSLEDIFGKNEVIIADKQKVASLFGSMDFNTQPELARRYRMLPCSTVSGSDTLEGFRCDRAEIESEGVKKVINNPVLAVSKVALKEDYNAIINPKVLR